MMSDKKMKKKLMFTGAVIYRRKQIYLFLGQSLENICKVIV